VNIVGQVVLAIIAVPVGVVLFVVGFAVALWVLAVLGSPVIALFTRNPREMTEAFWGLPDLIRDVQRGNCYECGKYSVHKKDDRGWYVLCPACLKDRPAKLERIAAQSALTAEDWRWLDSHGWEGQP
jgi:hypothetical protein